MQIRCTLSLIVAVMAGGLWVGSRASGMEVDLEWDIGSGTKDITTAMNMLRFANDTAPPSTEWVPLGWNYGTLSLQHRADSSSFVVMQVSPPSASHQVLLGKLSDLAEVSYHPTGEGPSQIVLESKVELDSSLPYYFKVEAHHDMLQNRTIYEGLYSIGNHWLYMGSIVLQHPNKLPPGTSIKAGRLHTEESSESNDSETKSEESKSEESKAEESKSEESKVDDAKSEEAKSEEAKSEEAKSDNVKSKDEDDDKDQDDDAMSDKEDKEDKEDRDDRDDRDDKEDKEDKEDKDDDDKDEKNERIQDASSKVRRRNEAKARSSTSKVESDSDSASDSDSDTESKRPGSTTKPATAPNKHVAKKMFDSGPAPQPDISSLRATVRSAFSDFLKSGLKAISPRDKKQSHSRNKRVDVSAASKNKNVVDGEALNLLKNGIEFPSYSVFPRLYSGVKRLEGGDSALVRAGVYKKFQLRDRLGETFFITQGRAFAYDGTDNDVSLVRHYFLSSSYLLSLDGPRAAASGDDEKQKEQSASSSSSTAET